MRKYFLLVFFITSCASTEIFNEYWIGKSTDDFIFSNGVPDKTIVLDNGRSVLEYNFKEQNIRTQSDGDIQTTNLYCIGSIFADTDKTIMKIDFRGNLGGCNKLRGRLDYRSVKKQMKDQDS